MSAAPSRSAPKSDAQKPTRQRAAASKLRLDIVGADHHADLPVRTTLRRWVALALETVPHAGANLALAFVDARAGRRLNREFRARDYATNVLTFAYEIKPRIAADIVICVPVVRREAREQGKTLRQHLAHLIIHGVLHARGFDHERGHEARDMQERERCLLARLRIPDPYKSC